MSKRVEVSVRYWPFPEIFPRSFLRLTAHNPVNALLGWRFLGEMMRPRNVETPIKQFLFCEVCRT